MESPYIQNPFPPPPRHIGKSLLFFAVAIVALVSCGYLIWILVVGEPETAPPSAPAPTAAAQSELATIAAQLKLFQKRVGRYPTASEGLDALAQRPAHIPREKPWPKLWAHVPRDPWNRSYEYVEMPGDPPGYRVFSKGPNPDDASDDIGEVLPPAIVTEATLDSLSVPDPAKDAAPKKPAFR